MKKERIQKSGKSCRTRWDEKGLYVPYIQNGSIKDLCIGKNLAFAELDTNGEVQLFRGLEYFIRTDWGGIPIVIVDNHNHVLSFRYEYFLRGLFDAGIKVVHVDQHTDMNENNRKLKIEDGELEEVSRFVNYECNVGNFIVPALESGLIGSVKQVTTEHALSHLDMNQLNDFVLDIDLDFWAPEMGIEEYKKTFEKVRELAKKASLITVATSPYFLDQELAIRLIKELFGEM